MRHRVYGKHLSRDKNQRTALFRGLVRSLILHESITTTESKAKAIKGLVDRLISSSRKNTPASLRTVYSFLPQQDISKRLISEIAPRFNRDSGFTQTVRLGMRAGDGAMMVKMSLIEDGKEEVKKQSTSRQTKVKSEEKEEAKALLEEEVKEEVKEEKPAPKKRTAKKKEDNK